MSWTLLIGIVALLGILLLAQLARRAELHRMERRISVRERELRQGSSEAQLMEPVIDLTRCLGCGSCVIACPEEGVLELVHGQAVVVRGARCLGHAACERECPVSAITVTIKNLEERRDVPVLSPELEAVGARGVFLAGEVTAHTLIKSAIDQGVAVAAEVARRLREEQRNDRRIYDLLIVGAGPAGLACSLEARRNGLEFICIDQAQSLGGTVATYPRQKLVLSQPVELPLYGTFKQSTYNKEDLMAVWQQISEEQDLPIETGVTFRGLQKAKKGGYLVKTEQDNYLALNVCLALGRRGIPRRLGVPGEDLPKVAYNLLDAQSYQGRKILVVGGGDSAVEAAVGLAQQEGNQVVISYRKESFFRIHPKNQQRLDSCVAQGSIHLLMQSEVRRIGQHDVELVQQNGSGNTTKTLPNDDVFIMAGGITPIEVLERSGVSFDPALREKVVPVTEQGSGLTKALGCAFILSAIALVWAAWHADYYALPIAQRPAHPKHSMLRPELGVGLWLGIAAVSLVLVNLLYLARKSPRIPLNFGSLKTWMTCHVATGILALLCAMLHAAMAPLDSQGGHAFWAMVVLIVTGAIGRYFYAYVPRAANGRELELSEVKAKLARMSEQWDQGQRKFREYARAELFSLIEKEQWKKGFFGRVLGLLFLRRSLKRLVAKIEGEGHRDGVSEQQIQETIQLVRKAHTAAMMAAHFEDLRAVLSSWRYLHRWATVLMLFLLGLHVLYALIYSPFFFGGATR